MRNYLAGVIVITLGVGVFLVSPNVGLEAAEPFPCTVAEEWAMENILSLPTTFEGIAALEVPYRRAAMRNIPTADRVAIWEEHLDRFLDESRGLSEDQVLFVKEIRGILPLAMSHGLTKDQVTAYGERALGVLPFTSAKAAFVTLGEPTWESPVYPLEGMEEASSAGLEDCDCDDEGSMWCGINFDCDEQAHCDPSYFGCGFLGLEACLGMCEWNPHE